MNLKSDPCIKNHIFIDYFTMLHMKQVNSKKTFYKFLLPIGTKCKIAGSRYLLTLSQTTDLKLFQIETVCR